LTSHNAVDNGRYESYLNQQYEARTS